jgi:response regulator RpfG family c-di-GMP phosphodiesterase
MCARLQWAKARSHLKASAPLPIPTSMMPSRVNPAIASSTAGPSGLEAGGTPGGSAFEVLLATLSACAPETYAHSRRVMLAAVATARTMELPASIVEQIEQASLLHDLGKLAMAMPEASAVGPQAELQAVLVRQHVRIGFDVLSVVPHLRPVASAVIAVHERWDGFGYPAGLRGTEIPLAARVIAVADAFDVLATTHRYHRGMTRDEANAELVRGAGTYFDPDIVRAWLRASDRLECS